MFQSVYSAASFDSTFTSSNSYSTSSTESGTEGVGGFWQTILDITTFTRSSNNTFTTTSVGSSYPETTLTNTTYTATDSYATNWSTLLTDTGTDETGTDFYTYTVLVPGYGIYTNTLQTITYFNDSFSTTDSTSLTGTSTTNNTGSSETTASSSWQTTSVYRYYQSLRYLTEGFAGGTKSSYLGDGYSGTSNTSSTEDSGSNTGTVDEHTYTTTTLETFEDTYISNSTFYAGASQYTAQHASYVGGKTTMTWGATTVATQFYTISNVGSNGTTIREAISHEYYTESSHNAGANYNSGSYPLATDTPYGYVTGYSYESDPYVIDGYYSYFSGMTDRGTTYSNTALLTSASVATSSSYTSAGNAVNGPPSGMAAVVSYDAGMNLMVYVPITGGTGGGPWNTGDAANGVTATQTTATRATSSTTAHASTAIKTETYVHAVATRTTITQTFADTVTSGSTTAGGSPYTFTTTTGGTHTTTTAATITHARSTYDTTASFSITHPVVWWTRYIREDGEIIFVNTVTATTSNPVLSAAGFTTTLYDNAAGSHTSSTGSTYTAGGSSIAWGQTVANLTTVAATSGKASITVSVDPSANYAAILPDASVFGFKLFAADSQTSTNVSLSHGAGYFDATSAVGNSTTQHAATTTTYSYGNNTSTTVTGTAVRIQARITLSIGAPQGLPVTPFVFATSITDSKT